MNTYKIVASDLDGTLLNSNSKISEINLDAIKQLSECGAFFVPSTGRTFSEIPQELRDNPDVRYVIHSNGAVVYDKQTGNKILNCIPNNICKEILDTLSKYETHITFRLDGKCFVDAQFQNEEAFKYYNVCKEHIDVVRNYAVHLENFKDFSYKADNVEVFSAFFHSYEEKLECRKQFEKNSNLRVVEATEYNLEVVNTKAGKGNALYALADLLGIDYSDTISAGDSNNDLTITQAAGLGLAVSNACDSLKEVADEIICSNDEHIVSYILNHYFS
ncbi:MAG: Cof-type HAD-IIB family hydrolase [Clostridia bacterium]|nr:Cof-type HAD-IIB family hydrolase [Clostridia bacterium]